MAEGLSYRNEAAAGYDRASAAFSNHFVPFLLRAARVSSGQHVLDIATGTGLAAAAALKVVGPGGHVTAADVSSAMVEKARERLGDAPNVAVAVEDGQAISFPEKSFDAVVCSLGLMFFPNPARGLAEFHRVLRPGGRAAVSVNTVAERSFNSRISVAIGRHVPSLAEAATRLFALGSEERLRSMFGIAGFREVEVTRELYNFEMPSFDAYFAPYEQGAGAPGQAYVALPEETRRVVREEVRQSMGDAGGPITIQVEIMFASGAR